MGKNAAPADATTRTTSTSSSSSIFSWGFAAILVYHVCSFVLLFHNHNYYDNCAGGTGAAGGAGQQRMLDISSSCGSNCTRQQVQSLSGIGSSALSQRSSNSNERQVSCTRWNYTYIFPKQPAFVIIGTQKGGTSALSALLDHHPWTQSSWYFEPHFFDFNSVMLQYRRRLADPEAKCKLLRTYLRKNYDIAKLRKYPNLLAFEKTPSYILTPNAPTRIKATIPWAKIIVTLRNPVDRLISQHKMTVMRRWENRTFAEHLAEDVNVLRHEGYWVPARDPMNTSRMNPPEPRPIRKYKTEGMLYRGLYARQLLPWLEHYRLGENLLVIRYEELKSNPRKVLDEVLDFVGAPRYDFPDDVVNKSYSPKSEFWLETYDPEITPELEAYLREFYKPYNGELADLLGDRWRDVWD